MSLRTRLTAWFMVVLSGMTVIFGTAVYSLLSISMIRQIDATLQRTAENMVIASILQVRGVPLSLIQLELDLTANVYVQVMGLDFSVIRQSQNLMGMEKPIDDTVLPVTKPEFSIVQNGGSRLRVLTIPVYSDKDGSVLAYYQLASSLNAVDHAQQTLLTILFAGGFGAILMGSVITWTATGSALAPLKDATETAEKITQSADLSLRIDEGDVQKDEVGRLVHAFNNTLGRLEKLFASQRQFMADISHELRTPLTTIKGNLAYMERVGEVDHEALDSMVRETDRMSRLVKDLLFLNRAEHGELPLDCRIVEVDTLLLEVYQQVKSLAADRVNVVLGEEDQARVMGDRDRLKQVLLNLCVNAIEFTPSGGTVTMNLRCNEDMVEIEVADTGEGIPEDSIPHIFDRFYRTDRSRIRRKLGGAGLGLSIADWIVKAHEGEIVVHSQTGKGSTFLVRIPALSEETWIQESIE